MRRSNARRRKVKKRVKFSKLYNSLSRERYALVTLCQLVPSSNDRSYVFTIRRRRARVKGDTLWRRTHGATEENRKKRVVLPVFKRMEGKVNTCRSFDPDLEREGGGKKKKKKRKGRKKKYSSTSSFVTHPRLPTCLEWNVRSLPLPLSSPLSTRCLAHHDGRPRFRRGVKRQRRGTRHARRFKGRGRGEGERGGGRPDFRVSYSPLNCTPTRKTNSSTWNVSQ